MFYVYDSSVAMHNHSLFNKEKVKMVLHSMLPLNFASNAGWIIKQAPVRW